MKFSKKILPLILLAGFGLSGCAEQNNWSPTVDVANDPHSATLANDMAVCKQLAHNAADQQNTVGEDTGVGLLGGAAGGALLGAIAGGPATGAALGAVAGTGTGFGMGASKADATYRRVYSNCLSKRGHPVLD